MNWIWANRETLMYSEADIQGFIRCARDYMRSGNFQLKTVRSRSGSLRQARSPKRGRQIGQQRTFKQSAGAVDLRTRVTNRFCTRMPNSAMNG